MKRALRIIVPVLLVLVIIACAAWYFLIYDQAFTKELLLNQARRFEASGNYKISAFLYDVAYYQSSRDDDVAIELAQQYLDMDNCTKAEYTLSQAIEEKPTAELYAKLCSVYVQQDKLLDAVNLLNGVADVAISKELDEMRPKAPAITPEPGFYSQYITIDVQSENAKLYVSTDAAYPSIEMDSYTGPITLTTGETVIYAIAINEQGLVSPLVINGYTIKGVVEVVQFTDKSLESAIRTAVDAQENEVLYTDRLWSVTELTVPAEAKSYADLKYLPHLQSLTISSGSQGDLSILNELAELTKLELNGIRLTEADLSVIATHTGLTHLSLASCSLSTIQVLAPLKNLTYLDLSANTLRNISILSGMAQLQQLYLGNNVVSSLESLSGLKELELLDISYNAVTSLSPLNSLQKLKKLIAPHNQIDSVTALKSMTVLEVLDVSHNNLSDISPLTGLRAMIELNASNNALASMSGVQNMTHLRILNLSYNQITELPAFQKQCELVNIDMSHNLLLNIDTLAGLPWLNTVNIDYNEEVADLLPLDTCHVLVRVNAFGTKVTEVSFLTAKSIIVNFDPTLDK